MSRNNRKAEIVVSEAGSVSRDELYMGTIVLFSSDENVLISYHSDGYAVRQGRPQ